MKPRGAKVASVPQDDDLLCKKSSQKINIRIGLIYEGFVVCCAVAYHTKGSSLEVLVIPKLLPFVNNRRRYSAGSGPTGSKTFGGK